jgi:N6-L-threonylcarbamoyladenine synthase
MTYVINQAGAPLMPCSDCKARHLLKSNRADIVDLTPFTIRLRFAVSDITEPVTLGVDAGYSHIGLSASTEDRVLFECEHTTRQDIVNLLEARRSLRRSRRNRRTRYRAPRFDNRVHSKNKGWLAPSIEARIGEHLTLVAFVHSILPVTETVVETAAFDIQKIRNPEIEGTGYQQGDQMGFWNVREYVLWRDNHKCRHCNGRSKDSVLEVHHLVQRKDGGSDRPKNLITLCRTCHHDYHEGKFSLDKPNRGFRAETFMGVMRWAVYERLKALYGNVRMTFGYITKNTRITHGLDKSHAVDARCIAGHPDAGSDKFVYQSRKVRCHNRQIHKLTILKGGIRKANQCPRMMFGFGLNDIVKADGRLGYIHGRRSSGSFDVRTLSGEVISHGISYKKLMLVEHGKIYTRRRTSSPA